MSKQPCASVLTAKGFSFHHALPPMMPSHCKQKRTILIQTEKKKEHSSLSLADFSQILGYAMRKAANTQTLTHGYNKLLETIYSPILSKETRQNTFQFSAILQKAFQK